jgi:hypothetical protein
MNRRRSRTLKQFVIEAQAFAEEAARSPGRVDSPVREPAN